MKPFFSFLFLFFFFFSNQNNVSRTGQCFDKRSSLSQEINERLTREREREREMIREGNLLKLTF